MIKLLKHSWVILIVCGTSCKAHAFSAYCGYGTVPAMIPPAYFTLYCRANINVYDLLDGDHIHQDTFVGAGTGGQSLLVIGRRSTTWAYHPALTTTVHYALRGPNMPVGQYVMSSEWHGLKNGQIYDGPKADSWTAGLGPP